MTGNYTDRLVAGAVTYGSDNEKIGTVADVGQNYFLVQKGWLFIKDLYLPTSTIARAEGDNVFLSLTDSSREAEQMGRDYLPNRRRLLGMARSAPGTPIPIRQRPVAPPPIEPPPVTEPTAR